jgi:hypothetical protein
MDMRCLLDGDCVVLVRDWPEFGDDAGIGAELVGAAQERPCRRGDTAAGRLAVVFGAGGQDAFDGAIGRVADLEGAGAGGLEALASVFVA